jgi:hypothetical protein
MKFIKPEALGSTHTKWKPGNFTAAIYALVDPRDGLIRYIGRTMRSLRERLEGHISDPSGKRTRAWIGELRALRLRPRIQLLAVVPIGMQEGDELWWIWKARQLGDILNSPTTHAALNR